MTNIARIDSAIEKGAGHAWQDAKLLSRHWSPSPATPTSRTTSRSSGTIFHVKLAEYPQPKKTVWLEQNVNREKLNWFYHADQGTRTFGIPYEWFMALEQPTIPWLIFTAVDPFSDPAYLDRYGFIPDTTSTDEGRASDRLRAWRPDAGSIRRALAQPEPTRRT